MIEYVHLVLYISTVILVLVCTGNKQHPKKSVLNRDNGHNTDSEQKEESSSSDQVTFENECLK